jgi:hypothetical protein
VVNSILLLVIKNINKCSLRILTITLNNGRENKFQVLYQCNQKDLRNLKRKCLDKIIKTSSLKPLTSNRMKKSLSMSWIELIKIANRLNRLTLSKMVIIIWIQSLSSHEITYKCLIHLENRGHKRQIMQLILVKKETKSFQKIFWIRRNLSIIQLARTFTIQVWRYQLKLPVLKGTKWTYLY